MITHKQYVNYNIEGIMWMPFTDHLTIFNSIEWILFVVLQGFEYPQQLDNLLTDFNQLVL